MKKHLWIIGIVGILITALYSITSYNWLIAHNLLQHQAIPEGRRAAWAMIIFAYISVPLMMWSQMESLYRKTGGNITKGTWQEIEHQTISPYKERFNLFLMQHPVWLYIFLVIPILYFYLLFGLIVINILFEWISWQWFKLTCWWDDFKLTH